MTEQRWRPVRAGIINVWRYDEEVFEFHQGRLLLRGPNGTGKSMALELLFPFLLDANASPIRLSSSAKSRGGLLERLLTGSEQSTRAGFLWAEFAHGERTFTIGVRLRASDSTKKVTSDWFTTCLRVGEGVQLLDENRTPLSRARLEEVLGHDGTVYESADAYREGVRSVLFAGFGPTQYDAMINALLALRREKISQNLTPERLSEILTAALPPLDEHEIAEVAEGYEKLDRRKENIERLRADVALVAKLANRTSAYARIVLGAVADEVRSAESRRDQVTRREREAKRDLDRATERNRELATSLGEAESGIRDRNAEMETLRALDAYKAGGALGPLRQELERQRRAREGCEADVREREADVTSATSDKDLADTQLADASSNEQRSRRDIAASADVIGAGTIVEQAVAASVEDGETLLEAWTRSREEQVRVVRQAVVTLKERNGDRNRWEEQVEADQSTLDRANDDLTKTEDDVEASWTALRGDVDRWRASCIVLALPEADLDDPGALVALAREHASNLKTTFAVENARLQAQAASLRGRETDLQRERELVSTRAPEPDPPSWRSARDRQGAPLWRLVDFAADCDAAILDRVEAALLASGLLDAWFANDGALTLPDGVADVLVDTTLPAVAGVSLEAVLRPLDDVAIPVEMTRRFLRAVAFAPTATLTDASTVIGADGSFRIGTLVGRGTAVQASFIGAAAQERRRLARIGEIDRELNTLSDQLAALAVRSAEIGDRITRLDNELATVPTGAQVREATRQRDIATALVSQADSRLQASRGKRDEASAAAREALAALMRTALAHSLPTGETELDAVSAGLVAFRRAFGAWSRRRRQVDTCAIAVRDAASRTATAEQKLAPTKERLNEATRIERDIEARLRILESTVGVDYRAIVEQLDTLLAEREDLEKRRIEISKELDELLRKIGKLETAVDTAEADRRLADEHRSRMHAQLITAVTEGIAADAGLEVDLARLDGKTSVLEASRSISQEFDDIAVDARARDAAHNKLGEALHEARQSLAGHVDFTFEQSASSWWLLRASTDGLRRSVGQLHLALEAELAAAKEELLESEQRLFDETLTGTVRQAVADRIRRSTELVSRIREQLTGIRTVAGEVQVSLRWEVDPEQPAAVKSARSLLLKDPAGLTDTERSALYAFFRARLDQVRAGLDGSAGWETRLREALDYRNWHRFVVDVSHRDWTGFVPATAARIQRLSTGERAMVLHLPMLASITAHYSGAAGAACPRLILLDELFAGVDTANRGQLFGLLVSWDLDAVLTSDHEWCAYASLNGIAIHFLHPPHGTDPVTSTRFVWDGTQRRPTPVA